MYYAAGAAAVLLMAAGVYLLFQNIIGDNRSKSKQWSRVSQALINQKREIITGRKLSWFDKFKAEADQALRLSNSRMSWEQFRIIVAVCGMIGAVFGLLLSNPLLSVIMFIGMMYVPLQILKIKQNNYTIYVNDQVQQVLNMITTTYLRSDDINKAVTENLSRIDEPLNTVFREFAAANTFIDSDIVKNIKTMKYRVNNQFFEEWCDTLILCQNNRNLKYVLPAIIESMSDIKNMQEELNTMMYQIYKEFMIIALLVVANIPFMKVLNAEWFAYLTQTMAGKIVVAVVALATLTSAAYVIKINKPISQV